MSEVSDVIHKYHELEHAIDKLGVVMFSNNLAAIRHEVYNVKAMHYELKSALGGLKVTPLPKQKGFWA